MQKVSVSAVNSTGFPEGLQRLCYVSGYDGLEDEALLLPPKEGGWWIVCLHGFEGRSNQIFMRRDIKQSWLPEFLKGGYGVLSPNLRGDSWMNQNSRLDLSELLDYLREDYGARHFIFTSGSMGATGSLIYACHRPEDVSGLDLHGAASDMAAYYAFCNASQDPLVQKVCNSIVMAYGGTPGEAPKVYYEQSALNYASILRGIPFFLMHGSLDSVMPVSQSRRLAAALCDSSRFVYMEVPGGDHNAPLALEGQLLPGHPSSLEWIRSFY